VLRKLVPIAAALALLAIAPSTSVAATTDTATAEASPGPYLVGQPITFTSTTPCTTACRLTWRFLDGSRLGDQLGEGVSVTTTFATPGLKTVELRLTESCVGTTRLTCASFAYVSVFVEAAQGAEDKTPPTFTVSGLNAEATGPSTVVNYTFSAADVDDAVVSQSCTPAPGSSFPVGSTSIECTATDSHGNVGNETFAVDVSDTTAPTLTVPAPITAEATSSAGADVSFAVSAMDAVDGPVTPSCSQPSGSTFPLGSTTVDCTATDSRGNSGTASFAVNVVDTTPPSLTVPAAIAVDATSPAGAGVTYSAAANDLVDGAVAPACSPASGSVFPIGTTTVSCTATDAHGNASQAKTFDVHVKGAAEQLADLLRQVQQFGLQGNTLSSRLQSVMRSVSDGSTAKACRQLADLQGDLSGALGKKLTAAQAEFVRGALARIANVLGCA
jgi:hypothetical protein